jgi:hypothetical protein
VTKKVTIIRHQKGEGAYRESHPEEEVKTTQKVRDVKGKGKQRADTHSSSEDWSDSDDETDRRESEEYSDGEMDSDGEVELHGEEDSDSEEDSDAIPVMKSRNSRKTEDRSGRHTGQRNASPGPSGTRMKKPVISSMAESSGPNALSAQKPTQPIKDLGPPGQPPAEAKKRIPFLRTLCGLSSYADLLDKLEENKVCSGQHQ